MTGVDTDSLSWGTSENLRSFQHQEQGEWEAAYFFPRRLRKPVMVLCAFLTSCCFAWFPMYCDRA